MKWKNRHRIKEKIGTSLHSKEGSELGLGQELNNASQCALDEGGAQQRTERLKQGLVGQKDRGEKGWVAQEDTDKLAG